MKVRDYSFKIGEHDIGIYHDTKTHRFDIILNFDLQEPFNVSKAKGEAIAKFLAWLEKNA